MFKKVAVGILAVVFLVTGAVLFTMPGLRMERDQHTEETLNDFLKMQEMQSPQKRKQQQDLAMWYNLNLESQPQVEELQKAYDQILNTPEGIMACLEIESIGLLQPIYHQSEQLPDAGVIHVSSSSLPIGGLGNHSILWGGAEAGEVFTRLAELKAGDLFRIHVLGEKLVYRVECIEIRARGENLEWTTQPYRDQCSLMTTTPYGLHTYLLIIRGERCGSDGAAA